MSRNMPKEVHQPLFAAIGETVINWTFIENALNFQIAIIYQIAGGKDPTNELPFTLKRKIEFLRRCYKKIVLLRPFASDGLALLNRISQIKDTRETLVHGTVADYSECDHKFLFVRIDLDKTKTMHVFRESSLTIGKILDDSGEAMSIGSAGLDLAACLCKALVPEYKEKELLRSITR